VRALSFSIIPPWLTWTHSRQPLWFETESLPVRSEGIWACLYILNTAVVENTVEVDRQPNWLKIDDTDFLTRDER
jgi:hypothetical protein